MFESSFPVPKSVDWMMILPIVVVFTTGIAAVIIELLRPKKPNDPIVYVSIGGLIVAALTVLPQFNMAPNDTLAGMVHRDQFSLIVQLLLIGACLLTILFSESYLRAKRIPYPEFYPLVLWSTSGGMMMATSKNLLVIFLGLELLSIALYCLAGMSRKETRSEESAMKYFLLGAFSTGFFIYGIAMYFGATGSLNLDDLNRVAQAANPQASTLLMFGIGLMLVGLAFKNGFAPFHQWTPDVYQGAPTNVTAFMAVASKIASVAALFRVTEAAAPLQNQWMPAMIVVAMLTMIVGNIVALIQTDIKRILGYSSIANAGYTLVAILAYVKNPTDQGLGTILYFLMSYSFVTLGSFAIITMFTKSGAEGTKIADLRGLWQRAPLAAIALLVFMISLIGVPPMAGFMAKLFIFREAMSADLTILAITLAATSVVSVVYYLQIAWAAFVSDSTEDSRVVRFSPGIRLTASICAVAVVISGILVNPIQSFLIGSESPASAETSRTVVER